MAQHAHLPDLKVDDLGEAFLADFAGTLPASLDEPAALPPGSAPAASECLSEDEVLGFAAGQLRVRQVRRVDEHLARCSTCSQLLTELLGELAGPTAANAPLVPCVFPPATQVAQRFVIERLIGRGGMGEVYAALDLKRRRTVALKTVLAERCDSRRAMTCLARELRALRAIQHPNVCRAHGMGVHRDGSSPGCSLRFIVMDYIEGETLGQRLRRDGALPLGRALLVGRQILLALEATHRAGLMHLDIKSDNVLLSAASEPGAILIDFGLARQVRPGEAGRKRRCSPRGTLSYMAPEQLLGQPLGPHTDVFGFGVVMYELLTGAHPFFSRPSSACEPEALLETRALRADELPLRPSRALEGMSPSLDAFVASCTEPDPRARFSDAAAALRDFDSLAS